MTLSAGKQSGLRALANERGIIAALAIDQRSALRKLFSAATGQPGESIPTETLAEFKRHVSRILTPYASAILLDPEVGLPAAADRAPNSGLLLAYEQSGYEKNDPARYPRLLQGFSVFRLKQSGANAIKVLLYYSPFSSDSVNARKQAWVESVGTECANEDIAFFLELVSYHDDLDEKSQAFAQLKPETVIRSVQEFCNPRYAVDVLKVGVPVNMKFVESPHTDSDNRVHSRAEAVKLFREASDASSVPFIYLSEGVPNELFSDALSMASEAGSHFSGVLCGRATWQHGVTAFVKGGPESLDAWLRTTGVQNIQNVNAQLSAAHPWFEKFSSASSGKG